MSGKLLTKVFIGIAFISIVLYDIWTYAVNGVETTISRITWHTANEYPPFGLLLILSIGFLLGHLFWAQRIVTEKIIVVKE